MSIRRVATTGKTPDDVALEAVRSQPGEGMALRDVLIGGEVEVMERTASRLLRSGDLAYGQLCELPESTTIRISGRSLVAEVNSEKRAMCLRKEIEQRLGILATHQKTVTAPLDLTGKRAVPGRASSARTSKARPGTSEESAFPQELQGIRGHHTYPRQFLNPPTREITEESRTVCLLQ